MLPAWSRNVASSLVLAAACAAVMLQPLPAAAQAACDPTTSYCGGSTGSSAQQQLQLPSLTNQTTPNPYQQNPYGTGGGAAGGINYTGPTQSIDLQPVPNYIDNLNGLGGRTEGTTPASRWR